MMPRANHDELQSLSESFGDAFFVADVAKFERNYAEFLDAFRRHYPRTEIAYSYKTNYLPEFCLAVERLGGQAEVVSRMEYDLAKRLGVSPSRIVFNGPYRDLDDIETALVEGATVNLDGPRQLGMVEALRGVRDDLALRVGLRVNFAIASTSRSRFGFDADGDEVERAVQRLTAAKVELAGLHCHFATGTRDLDAYAAISERMVELGQRYLSADDRSYLDVGGGFFSRMPAELAAQFGGPIPAFEDYGHSVGRVFSRTFGTSGPRLILEPGVALAADAMYFAARVLEVRTLGGRRLALVAGSIHNVKPTLNRLNLPMHVVRPRGAESAAGDPHDVVGYTCMEHDVLHVGGASPISAGDWVVFENVGAYTNVLAPPFIRPAPPILGLERDGEVRVLRRGQTLEDILATYSTTGVAKPRPGGPG